MQYNKSAILLEGNDKLSRSKRTKHIKTRFLFVMYRVAHGDLEIDHCPAEKFWADVLIKPLQVRAFGDFRAELMNFPADYKE